MKELKPSNINLFTMLRDLVYNLWVVVLAAIIGFVGVTSYYQFIYKPVYTSTMTVAVDIKNSNGIITSNVMKTIEISGILQNIFKSDVLNKVVKEKDEDFEIGSITASVVKETNLITISATSDSKFNAYKSLKAIFNNYEEVFSDNVFSDVFINILVQPTVPMSASNAVSSRSRAILVSFALAALTALAFCGLSFLRDTVKQERDIEEYVDGNYIGTVYHEHIDKSVVKEYIAKRKDLRISIMSPLISYNFTESINRIATKIEYFKNSREAKSIIVTSVDEHEGKTTISTNIAINLAQKGYKVLLMDADLRRASVYKAFDADLLNSYSELGDYLLGKIDYDDIIKHDEKTNLDVIGGHNSYKFAFELLGSETFKELVKKLYGIYDYVIIDTPPMSLTADTENIADLVDVSMLVVHQDRTYIAEINDEISILSNSKSYFAGCILNDCRTIVGKIFPEKLLSENGYGKYGSYYYKNKEKS